MTEKQMIKVVEEMKKVGVIKPVQVMIEPADYLETVELITKQGRIERPVANFSRLLTFMNQDCVAERFVIIFDTEKEGYAYEDCSCMVCIDSTIEEDVREALENKERYVSLDVRNRVFYFTDINTALYEHHQAHNEMSVIKSIFDVSKYELNKFHILNHYEDDSYKDGFASPASYDEDSTDYVSFTSIGEGFMRYNTSYSNDNYWFRREFGITEEGEFIVFDYECEDDEDEEFNEDDFYNLRGARLFKFAELYQ